MSKAKRKTGRQRGKSGGKSEIHGQSIIDPDAEYTTNEAAIFLQVSQPHIRHICGHGRMGRAVRQRGQNVWMIRGSEILALAKEGDRRCKGQNRTPRVIGERMGERRVHVPPAALRERAGQKLYCESLQAWVKVVKWRRGNYRKGETVLWVAEVKRVEGHVGEPLSVSVAELSTSPPPDPLKIEAKIEQELRAINPPIPA